ncbi:MAG: oligosaccharide flippase family protein, partial [Calditrichaeota bacterium]|nr:oligosaccharide flippase family protein [Calditrichota bacterium]
MSTSLRHIIGATFATQVAAFLITVGGQVLAARWLGPLQFGVMATLLMFADAVNKFTNFGLETSILYFVSNRRYPFRRFIGTNIINGLVLYGMGVLVILSFMYAGGMSLLFRPEEAVLGKAGLWWGIYLLFAAIVHEYGGNIWLGLQQFRRYNGNILTRPVIYVALLLLVYVQGALDVNAALAIYGTSWLLPG